MAARKHERQNLIFSGFVMICTTVLAVFIVMAIGMVLMRGLPGITRTIFYPDIQFSIKLSLITSFISTLLCLLWAVPAAYTLSRYRFQGKQLISTLLSLPIALPPLVSGVALLLLFGTTEWGKNLAAHGIQVVFTPLGIIIAQFFVNVPYLIKICRSTFDSIDPRLEFIARTLGSNRLQAFYTITLPLSFQGLMAGTLITWARALGEFGAALMLAGATRMKTDILPVSLYLNMSTGDLEKALTSATILIIISILSLSIFEFISDSGHGIKRSRL